jgi:hypothetical protein
MDSDGHRTIGDFQLYSGGFRLRMEVDEVQVVSEESLEIWKNYVELTQPISCKVRQPSYQPVDHISGLHS